MHRDPEPRVIFASRARRTPAPARLGLLLAVTALAVLAVTTAVRPGLAQHRAASGPLGAADGYVPTGASVSPFGDDPAVARLRPDLRRAIRRAASAARGDGLVLRVNGGWRSHRYQAVLLARAVRTYGSLAEARRYVLPPSRSSHVHGAAVDVGPTDAALWLEANGSTFGLCRTYGNELWHFELATAPGRPCPAMRPDAAG